MLSTIITIVHTVWGYLPQITAGLQFGAALIGFCLTADVAVQAMAQPDASSPVKSHGPRSYLALLYQGCLLLAVHSLVFAS
jgi:hypothetical protein